MTGPDRSGWSPAPSALPPAVAPISRKIGNCLAVAVLVPVAVIVLSPLYWLAVHAVRWAVS